MAKLIQSGGVDFDDLFDPDIIGDGPQAVWLTDGGVPLRYAALAYGTKRADVGYYDGGVDVSNLWAAKGTAVYTTSANGKSYLCAVGAFTTASTASANVQFIVTTDGLFTEKEQRNSSSATVNDSGTWLPAGGVASDYEVQFAVTVSSQAGATVSYSNSAAAYTQVTGPLSVSVSASCPGNVAVDRYMRLSVTMRIRKIATGVVVSTSTFTMEARAVGYV